jgi:hypothetical protein
MTTYRERLQAELAQLRTTRVGLRRQLEWFGRGHMLGDQLDTQNQIRALQQTLRATEPRWQELNFLLGRETGQKPVSLRLNPRERDALARQGTRLPTRAAARPTVRNVGYMTKIMVPGR